MSLNNSFQNLIDDITKQVLDSVQAQVQATVAGAVSDRLQDIVNDNVIHAIVTSKVQESIQNYTPDLKTFEDSLKATGTQIINRLQATADQKVGALVNEQLSGLDINHMMEQFITGKLDSKTNYFPFKDASIPGAAIDPVDLKITGDNITGGVIQSFASTGIEDKATQCQVTVLDQGTVFENTLYAPRVEIKGGAVIDGDLTISGNITNNTAYQQLISDAGTDTINKLGPELLDAHQTRVFERLQQEGLDLNKITIGGQSVIEGDRLMSTVKNSQLQTLGVVRDLQTEGEALLSQTLYASNGRVGINTMDPNNTVSIWDEEIEIGIGKQKQNTARIGTPREHTLILGSNKQDNIALMPDGVTVIPKLRLGNMLFSSSASPPNYNASRGTVVFNEQPNLGGPLGWVSLGDARWANFGIID